MALDKKNSINNILEERRIFPPSKEFAESSNIRSQKELLSLKKQASDDPIKFWKSFANSERPAPESPVTTRTLLITKY